MLAEEEEEMAEAVAGMFAWDDVSGSVLDPIKVRRARLKELEYIKAKEVWRKIPRKEALRRGIKIIPTRWIDVNKGDDVNENYRSRCVAKEFNVSKEEGLFAATPPLEALKYLISTAATYAGPCATRQIAHTGLCAKGGSQDKVVMINDVARAFFRGANTEGSLC